MLKSCCTLIRGCTLFPARTIVRDSHHCNSPTCCWQDLNLCTNRCWFSGVVITTTPLHQHLLHHIKWIEIHSIYNKTSIQIHVATTYFSKQKQNILKNELLNMSRHPAKNLNVHVGYTKINIYWYCHVN